MCRSKYFTWHSCGKFATFSEFYNTITIPLSHAKLIISIRGYIAVRFCLSRNSLIVSNTALSCAHLPRTRRSSRYRYVWCTKYTKHLEGKRKRKKERAKEEQTRKRRGEISRDSWKMHRSGRNLRGQIGQAGGEREERGCCRNQKEIRYPRIIENSRDRATDPWNLRFTKPRSGHVPNTFA